jgi:acylphosphatase
MIATTVVQHVTVYFTGHVQGVGFRYTARRIAHEFEVTGFVKNLADGRVQLEVVGAPAEIDGFLAAIEERMHGHIRKTERQVEGAGAKEGKGAAGVAPVTFNGFEIR